MQDHIAAEIQLDLRELAAWERCQQSQTAALARLRDAALQRQQPHILTDPAGRALAVATTDGVLHMLASPILRAAGEGELVDERPTPGFHANRTATFYVTADGRIFRLRAPGQQVSLQRAPILPDDCEEVDDDACDHDLCLLAETADALIEERVQSSATDDDPSAWPGEAVTTYARIDGVHYQLDVGTDHVVEISSAAAGRRFLLLGRGRWDGARLHELTTKLPAQVQSALEAVLRRG